MGIEDSCRYWSVFMVLDHLRIVDEGMTQIVHTLTDDRLFGQEVRIQDVKPSPQSGPETIGRFLKAVDEHESTVTRLGTTRWPSAPSASLVRSHDGSRLTLLSGHSSLGSSPTTGTNYWKAS
ncbi:MAG: hypothetical protein ACXW4C_03160 [Nitrospira sp.]